jgi:hypothetical protein
MSATTRISHLNKHARRRNAPRKRWSPRYPLRKPAPVIHAQVQEVAPGEWAAVTDAGTALVRGLSNAQAWERLDRCAQGRAAVDRWYRMQQAFARRRS